MSDKPSVLFVCVHNAGRSQMAAGWLRHLAGDTVEVRSAGSEPGDRINPAAVEAMAEVGIDITGQTPKKLDWETAESSDVIITMGCGDACPIFPGKRYEDWKLDDPAGRGVEPSARSATRSGPGSRSCSPTWSRRLERSRPPRRVAGCRSLMQACRADAQPDTGLASRGPRPAARAVSARRGRGWPGRRLPSAR